MHPVNINNTTQSIIVTVVFVWPIINQLKNGFNARFVWFGFTMIASICGYKQNDITFLYFYI